MKFEDGTLVWLANRSPVSGPFVRVGHRHMSLWSCVGRKEDSLTELLKHCGHWLGLDPSTRHIEIGRLVRIDGTWVAVCPLHDLAHAFSEAVLWTNPTHDQRPQSP